MNGEHVRQYLRFCVLLLRPSTHTDAGMRLPQAKHARGGMDPSGSGGAAGTEKGAGHGGIRTLNLYDYESCVLTIKLRALAVKRRRNPIRASSARYRPQ